MKWPWWVSVLLSILSYYGLKYGLPVLVGEKALPEDFLKMLAPLTAMGFLLLAAKQLYDIPPADENYPDQTQKKVKNEDPRESSNPDS